MPTLEIDAMRTTPFPPPEIIWATSENREHSETMRRAWGSSSSPCGVGLTPKRPFSSTLKPHARSRSAIMRLTLETE